MKQASNAAIERQLVASGEFVDFAGERYYAIRDVDRMAPFFISIVSSADHWLFVSSTGGLTAGRVSPETAFFPYETVDKIHDSTSHTGSKTLLWVSADGRVQSWEPFRRGHEDHFFVSRNLYKSVLGDKLCFEEINHDLQLAFRYTWVTSDRYGFVRRCELQNLGRQVVNAHVIDGVQNILPAGTPRFTQTNSSNLVDAYKWTELDEQTGLALYTLYSGITDRAEPCESLRANTCFVLGLEGHKVLLSSTQLRDLHPGASLHQEVHRRGVRGAYLACVALELAPQLSRSWQLVANIEQSQAEIVALRRQLRRPVEVAEELDRSVEEGSLELRRMMATADGFQETAEENVAVHHYANVLFNTMRGGIFNDQYGISSADLAATIRHFNRDVYQRSRALLDALPERLDVSQLLTTVRRQGDPQLLRLCYEYLPITFGRRHGDPSRPWNQFAINLKDSFGNRLLSYQGNWRDIFQNWEAMTFSYPEFVESVIARFVNASTMDGYNPYRITKEGIDWEVEERDDPWSYIGYWGDHQIIYLQKLLELSRQFHPKRLGELLRDPIYCYANVPYRIKSFDAVLRNPKSTVSYDQALADEIVLRVAEMGADGKLVLDDYGDVYQVNLLEKLLVPLLCKLGNFVIDGGIWLNTQRPEWNDANNALVGHGLSMVTLYYMRRYVNYLRQLLADESGFVEISAEVGRWLEDVSAILKDVRPLLGKGPITAEARFASMKDFGDAASRYRERVYRHAGFSGRVPLALDQLGFMLQDALAAIDHSIGTNRREDGLYHAYNLLIPGEKTVYVDTLYPMLEGQVAALSSGAIDDEESCALLEALFVSDIYRPDQRSFMLYPDRQLPSFLEKNRILPEDVDAVPLLQLMLHQGDERVISRDDDGCYRFNSDLTNVDELDSRLDLLAAEYGRELDAARSPLRRVYEKVFNHRAFTGRSGTMFGFEGLGSIYWHMVSKLLLAVQERFFAALESGDPAARRNLGRLYYRVREGLGFNKSPAEYGAFPTDPYSHTPRHAGARQPGMTGQVKEEVLCRFGELGLRVTDGILHFHPGLLRRREFVSESRQFRYLDVDGEWQSLTVPPRGLAFTWCQVPFVYVLDDDAEPAVRLDLDDCESRALACLSLPVEESTELFLRSGRVRLVTVTFGSDLLFAEPGG